MSDPVQVQCFTCSRFSFPKDKEKKEWLDSGYGNCSLREPFIMFSAVRRRDCASHTQADAEIVAKRDEWMKGKSL